MASVDWPEALAQVLIPEASPGLDQGVARTEYESGLVAQKRRSSAIVPTVEVQIIVRQADFVRFRSWAQEFAHDWFEFRDPVSGVREDFRVSGGAPALVGALRMANDRLDGIHRYLHGTVKLEARPQ